MPLIPRSLMVWQIHTIGIVVRVVGGTNHKMIAGYVISPGFGRIPPIGDRDGWGLYVLIA